MGEGDMVPDKPESLENGNAALEEKVGAVMDNKEEHHGETDEMEEDKKDDGKVEACDMDVDVQINKTEETEETVKDEELVKKGKINEEEEENKEEDKQAVLEEGKVEAKDEVMDNDAMEKTQETGEKVEEEVEGVEDEERSEEPKPEKGLMKKRPRTKNDASKMDKIKKKETADEKQKPKTSNEKKETVDRKQKPKTSNEKKVEEHETSTQKEDPKTPMTYTTDRPVRERKSVERLVATIEKDAAKEFHVEKGRGTALKDIPNVAYMLSRKKNDDTFRLLHNILFGRRGKAAEFKNNMLRFSGFVWNDDEEKQTIKVKEKLDKIVKEKLVDFCDVLGIPVSKANTRKEDITTRLMEFLMEPCATTTELLTDKEQSSKGKKRKRVSKSASESSTPLKGSAKSTKKTESTSKKGKETKGRPDSEDESEDKNDEAHEDEDANGVLEKSEDEMSERAESEQKDGESEKIDEDKVKLKQGSAKSSVKKRSTGKAKTKKVTISKKADPPPDKEPVKSPHSRSKSNKGTSAKGGSGKKKDEIVKEKTSTPKKSPSSLSIGKKILKGKEKPKEAKVTPSDYELRNAICELLKEVDFNTATFTDVLKLLAKRFREDLTPRKSSIKLMIQEELTKLADSEDDEGDAEKDGKNASTSVKA